jgi:hypothetical protein
MNAEIEQLLNENTKEDLVRFLKKRRCLNSVNIHMNYFFHLLQTAGLLTTAIAQSYNLPNIVWVGVGLGSLASLIHIYEQTNNTLSKRMLANIQQIKDGTYTDESILIEADVKKDTQSTGASSTSASIANASIANASIANASIANAITANAARTITASRTITGAKREIDV